MNINVTPIRDLPLDNISSNNGSVYKLSVQYIGSITLDNATQWSFFTDSTIPKAQIEVNDYNRELFESNDQLFAQTIKVRTWENQFTDSKIENWHWVSLNIRLTEFGLICVDSHIKRLGFMSIIDWGNQLRLEYEPQFDFISKLANLQFNHENLNLNCCYFIKIQIRDILILHNSYIFKKIQNSNLCIKDLELIVIDKFNSSLNLTINNNLLDFLNINYNTKKWKSSIELDSEILDSIKNLKKSTYWDELNGRTYQILVQLQMVSRGVYKWVYKCGC